MAQITVTLDDHLICLARALTGIQDESELIQQALKSFV